MPVRVLLQQQLKPVFFIGTSARGSFLRDDGLALRDGGLAGHSHGETLSLPLTPTHCRHSLDLPAGAGQPAQRGRKSACRSPPWSTCTYARRFVDARPGRSARPDHRPGAGTAIAKRERLEDDELINLDHHLHEPKPPYAPPTRVRVATMNPDDADDAERGQMRPARRCRCPRRSTPRSGRHALLTRSFPFTMPGTPPPAMARHPVRGGMPRPPP